MKGNVILGQNLIWVMLLLRQLHGYKSCIQKERMSLLELKTYLISTTQEEFVSPTWTNDTTSDCCRWEGVHCNPRNKRVTGLSISRVFFKENSLLNLSLLHPFEEIRSLNLSECYCNGFFDDMEGYRSLRRLSKLETLDLSHNEFNNSIFPFLNSATSLTTLLLRDNYMDGPVPVKELRNLTNLELLDLSINSFNGSMPVRDFPHLKNLTALILWGNEFSTSMELQELNSLTNLEVLDVGANGVYGPVPIQAFCEMKNLRELNLGANRFVGPVPLCLGGLNKLRVLDLSFNQFSGNLPSSFSSLQSLEYLSLSYNDFKGLFSLSPLANLTKLKVFKLSSTSTIQVETESTWQPKFQLSVAALTFCNLEKIPSFLFYQKNLRLVDLSSNRISGNIPTWLLENNPQLEVLQLQNNSFTILQIPTIVHKLQFLDISANDINGVLPDNMGHVLPNLVHMNGSDNGLQGNFPSSMAEMKSISFLDLSHNNFSGELPTSLLTGCLSLTYLQLSHNKFSGHVLPRQTSLPLLTVLRLNDNFFTGKIGDGGLSFVNLSVIDMSNNFLEGAIPTWITDLPLLYVLLLSNNLLEGTIPPSLLAKPNLSFLDLSGNLLSGTLPSYVSSTHGLKLFLDSNKLTGPIPRKLLENVNILTIQNNELSGSIPEFVNTKSPSILLLRGNNLTEYIPRQLCDLSNMRLLDLSHNKLNGFIPSCLNNLSFGLGEEDTLDLNNYDVFSFGGSPFWGFYKSTLVDEIFELDYDTYLYVAIKFAAKHRYEFYSGNGRFSGGTLDYIYGMDLSSNGLNGVIPAELGDLLKLRVLNLSHNFLTSVIPDNFSKLKDIESLDLSYNKLHGNIPRQLTNLTSLAVFNVSYNNLSGIIPQGVQFNTFSEDSYLGNPLLCGTPTKISCEAKQNSEEGDNGGEEEEDQEADIDMMVFYWSTGSTYVVALVSLLVLMCFDCSLRQAWIHLIDAFIASAKSLIS